MSTLLPPQSDTPLLFSDYAGHVIFVSIFAFLSSKFPSLFPPTVFLLIVVVENILFRPFSFETLRVPIRFLSSLVPHNVPFTGSRFQTLAFSPYFGPPLNWHLAFSDISSEISFISATLRRVFPYHGNLLFHSALVFERYATSWLQFIFSQQLCRCPS